MALQIGHAEIAAFADESVNLKRDDAKQYREQVGRLREKLDKYAADHPDYGLIKTLLSGSLAKGTALKTLNDIDVAFYVKAEKTPKAEPDLLEWLAARIRDAYPQMKPDQIKPNKHSVCIKYAVSGLTVDVVPVQYKGDPDDRGYLFAFDGGQPVLTSIPLHLTFIRKRKTKGCGRCNSKSCPTWSTCSTGSILPLRFEHLFDAARAIRNGPLAAHVSAWARNLATRAKWALWNGQADKTLAHLEAVRRWTLGERWPTPEVHKLRRHAPAELPEFQPGLANYGERHSEGEPISTAWVESSINEIVAKSIAKAQQMRWNRRTVQPFLAVRGRAERNVS